MKVAPIVLLVDGDPAALKVTEDLLRRLNCIVLSAPSPTRAVEICRTLPTRLDLLLTHVQMPEVNGFDLVQQVRHLHPDVSVVYMAKDLETTVLLREQQLPYLTKPFAYRELQKTLNSVLRGDVA